MTKDKEKKENNKIGRVLILVLGFAIIGLGSIFFTHQAPPSSNLVSAENYANYIKPWLENIYIDQSLDNIKKTKNNFLNFKGSDASIGTVHLSLFLGFDAWERFLLTGDEAVREQSIGHFSSAALLLPELSFELQKIENILEQQNA